MTEGKRTESLAQAPTELMTVFDYCVIIRARWRMIVGAALAAFVLTLVVTKFLMTRYYRATAVLRPVTEQGAMSRLQGMAAMPSFGGIMGNANDDKAEEYISILQSYEFTMAVVDRARLLASIDPPPNPLNPFGPDKWTDWQTYRAMQKRFDCSYDRLTGNLTLHFLDPDPAEARRVRGVYVDYLRDKLRGEEERGASAAVDSLKEEARSTADTLMQTQLYELIARQLQREKVAQVEADFAFKVIDPPVVPDVSFSPRSLGDALLWSALAVISICMILLGQLLFKDVVVS